jgi:hypothetical protein
MFEIITLDASGGRNAVRRRFIDGAGYRDDLLAGLSGTRTGQIHTVRSSLEPQYAGVPVPHPGIERKTARENPM